MNGKQTAQPSALSKLTRWHGDGKTAVAMRISFVTLLVNLALSIVKLAAGLFAKSGALISDSIHSFSDVFSTIIVMFGITASSAASDAKHQYGHERLEYVASLTLAIVLIITGLSIGFSGCKVMLNPPESPETPGILALIAAIISIITKEWMFWYTYRHAKAIDSGALLADAWHHRSDALSSIGALIGIGGARCGYPLLDPLASMIICLFIIHAGAQIFRDASNKLSDASCPPQLETQMREMIAQIDGVKAVDDVKTRQFGSRVFVDVEIAADGELKLRESHSIAERVHSSIEEHFSEVKHCTVHVNPYNAAHTDK
ncbi:MAG: cation diffusion facilitator family transporter [bacterium]|nr:cation diffusion facilitator family transporter [bacterium]